MARIHRPTRFFLPAIMAVLSFPFQQSQAIPARPDTIKITGPEGTEISAIQYGDENFNFYRTTDGVLLKRIGDEFFYAEINDNGSLQKAKKAVRTLVNIPKSTSTPPRKISGLIQGSTFPTKGEQRALVILVEYQDVKFNLENPLDYFTRMLNEEGFSDYRATGSARDFFIYSSSGQFTPQFDVYGPVTLQYEQAYYGGNDAFGQDQAPQRMVIEACRQLNPEIDFSQYDLDNDQYIDNVFIFYAGQGEASGGSSDCVWPHSWEVEIAEMGSQHIFDNVHLNRYACSNEWELSALGYGYRPVGIGTFIHEFSHVMGLPDLYSTQYVEDTFTPGAWSVMDYGPYNNDGCTPPQYSIFERSALGYINPPELTGIKNISLNTVDKNDGYIIPTSDPDEYFLIENRQQKEWDTYIPGHGMLVWHIDYNEQIWASNTVNNDPNHYHIDIIEADGSQSEDSRDGDCFPGASAVTALTGDRLISWDGHNNDLTLTDIAEKEGKILFRLNGGEDDIAATTALPPQNILAGGFTARWMPVEGATGYTISVYAKDETDKAVYVSGYENLFVGNTTCYEIKGLTPSSTYYYNVKVEDGLYGSSPSNEIEVTTLDPTIDYFAPTALDAKEITDKSFVAVWEQMNDATDYYIDVFTQIPGTPSTDIVDFSKGANNLPDGWSSTTQNTYGMSSYSGEQPPSLRLSSDGHSISSPVYDKDIVNLEFWMRGNQTGDKERLVLDALIDSEWHTINSYPITTQAGGQQISQDFSDIPGVRQIRLTFTRIEKGSAAIDDIHLQWGIPMIDVPLNEYTQKPTGNVQCLKIENLQPSTDYFYRITASDGNLTSLPSNIVKVRTLDTPSRVPATPEKVLIVSANGKELTTSLPVTVYDIAGRIIAVDVCSAKLPSAGIYLIRTDGLPVQKIIIF